MASYNNLIKLEVKIDPKNQAEQQLNQIINNLSKLKISINLDANINSQLKQVSDNINKIYSNSNKKITLGDISKSAEQSAKVFEKQLNLQEKVTRSIQDLETKQKSLNRIYGDKIDTSSIDKAIKDLKSMDNISMSQLNNELANVNSEVRKATEEAKSSESVFSKLGKTMSNFGLYINIGDVVRWAFNSLKDGVQVITDIDTAMRDLAKVSSATTEQLTKFPQIANQIAIETGTSTEAIIKATEYYSKLGYSITEASERAKNATIFANVADMNIDDASKALITISKGFNLNKLEDMNRIMDVANEIGNNYSSTSQDVAEGLRRCGNAMSEAGNSYEQSVGIFVSANASIQDSEVVGNAIKTITMRLRGMKTEIDETGIPVSKLREAIKDITATTGQTVDIMKNDNTFKNTYDIMNELSEVYPKLTDAQRSYLQYVIAGQRQGNIFSGIMNNMKEGTNAYTTALGASGSAMKEQQVYMDSIEGKTNALKETFKKFWVDSINSNMIKGFVDGTNSLVSTFGNLETVVMVATTALLLFKGSAILEAITPIFTFGSSLITLTTELGATTVASDLASASMTKLSAGASANPFGIIALACTGAFLAIQKVNSELDKVNNKITPLNESLSNLSSIKSSEALVKQYEDLEKVINSSTSSIEDISSAKENLLQVQKQLASNMPELITGYTEEGEAIATNIDKIKAKISNDLGGSIKQAQSNYKELFDQLNSNNISGFARYNKTYDERTQIEEYQELLNKQGEWTDKESERYTELNKNISSMNQAVMQLQSNGQDVSDMKIFDFETGKLVDAEEYLNDMANSADDAKSSADDLANGIDGISDSADKASTSLENLSKAFNDLSNTNSDIDSVIADMQEFGGITEQTYSKIIDNPAILQALTSEGDTIQNLTKLQEENRQSMEDRIQQAVDTANGVNSSQQSEADSKVDTDNQKQQSDSNTNNQIRKNTSDTTTQNSENYSKDGGNFDSTSQAKNTSDSGFQSAWRGNTADSVNEMGGMYQTDYSNFKSATDAKNALLENFRSNLASMGSVFSNAEDALNPLVNTLTQPWNVANGSSEGIAGALDNAFGTDSLKAMQEYKDGLSQIAGTFDSITGKKITTGNVQAPEIKKVSSSAPSMVKGNSGESGSKGGSGGSGSSGESDAEKWTDKIKELNSSIDIDRYADLNSQLDILDNHFTDNKNSLDGLTEGTKAYHDKQKEQIDIMKEQASTYSLLAGSYATERDELKQNLSQYGILTDATGKLTNAEAKLKYQQDLANDMSGNTEEEYKAKKKQIDAIKELEENIKRYREVTESEIPKCTQKWDELNNTIIKTQREQLQAMMDDLASALETKYSKAKEEELQKVEDWYSQRKENLESEYQQDLASLQDEKQSIVDEYDEQIKKLQAQLDKLNDESDNKQAKLSALKAELALWGKDTSVFSKRKQEELNQSIKDLELEIQKDNLQKEIDALKDKQSAQEDSLSTEIDNLESAHDDELDELEKSYNAKKKETEDHYDKLLDEQSRYNEASKLMMSNSQEEILELLQSKSEDWKNVGILLGENFADGLRSQVEQVMSDLSSLTGGTLGKNNSTSNNNSYTSKENNMATSSGNNNSKSNSINGKSYTVDDSGNISSKDALSNEEIAEIQKKIARFATGGRTPSNMSGGKLGILDPNEKILNSEDTNTFDKGMEIINTDLKDFIDKFDSTYKLNTLNGYSNLDVFGNTTDLNSMANRAMNNTTNNSSDNSTIVQMDVNIVNNNLQDVGMNEKNIEKVIRKVVKTDGRRFK